MQLAVGQTACAELSMLRDLNLAGVSIHLLWSDLLAAFSASKWIIYH